MGVHGCLKSVSVHVIVCTFDFVGRCCLSEVCMCVCMFANTLSE